MHPFARPVLGNYPRSIKIDFARDSLDQGPRAGHDRGDLERSFQEPLEKKNAHREFEKFTVAFRLSSSETGWRRLPGRGGPEEFWPRGKREFDFNSSLYND